MLSIPLEVLLPMLVTPVLSTTSRTFLLPTLTNSNILSASFSASWSCLEVGVCLKHLETNHLFLSAKRQRSFNCSLNRNRNKLSCRRPYLNRAQCDWVFKSKFRCCSGVEYLTAGCDTKTEVPIFYLPKNFK